MKKTLLLLTGLMILILSSCGKKGCADMDATNYNSKIKPKNSCNCVYEGNVVFWYNQTTANLLLDDGATSLTYYVDGEIIGSSACNTYWTGVPSCGQNGSITVTKDLGSVKNKTYSYSVKDQTGFEYWNGIVNFTANTCQSVELN